MKTSLLFLIVVLRTLLALVTDKVIFMARWELPTDFHGLYKLLLICSVCMITAFVCAESLFTFCFESLTGLIFTSNSIICSWSWTLNVLLYMYVFEYMVLFIQ